MMNHNRVFKRTSWGCGSRIPSWATRHGRRVRSFSNDSTLVTEYSLDLINAILATPQTQHPSKDDIAKVLEQVSFFFSQAAVSLPLVLSARPGRKRVVVSRIVQLLVPEHTKFLFCIYIYHHVPATFRMAATIIIFVDALNLTWPLHDYHRTLAWLLHDLQPDSRMTFVTWHLHDYVILMEELISMTTGWLL